MSAKKRRDKNIATVLKRASTLEHGMSLRYDEKDLNVTSSSPQDSWPFFVKVPRNFCISYESVENPKDIK